MWGSDVRVGAESFTRGQAEFARKRDINPLHTAAGETVARASNEACSQCPLNPDLRSGLKSTQLHRSKYTVAAQSPLSQPRRGTRLGPKTLQALAGLHVPIGGSDGVGWLKEL